MGQQRIVRENKFYFIIATFERSKAEESLGKLRKGRLLHAETLVPLPRGPPTCPAQPYETL